MKVHTGWWASVVAAQAYVSLCSVLGLTNAMLTAGPRIFGIVWGASFAGDVVFVLGTLAVGSAAYQLAKARQWAFSVLFGGLAEWFVYALAFSLTGPAMKAGSGPFAEVVVFTGEWGWPGLVFAAIAPALAFRFLSPDGVKAAGSESKGGEGA